MKYCQLPFDQMSYILRLLVWLNTSLNQMVYLLKLKKKKKKKKKKTFMLDSDNLITNQ